jgi:hypothetical protein
MENLVSGKNIGVPAKFILWGGNVGGSNPFTRTSLGRDYSFRKTAEAVLLPAYTRPYA